MMGSKAQPEVADYTQLKYMMRCVNESMRLYPHPPVLLRRAQIQDELPGALSDLGSPNSPSLKTQPRRCRWVAHAPAPLPAECRTAHGGATGLIERL